MDEERDVDGEGMCFQDPWPAIRPELSESKPSRKRCRLEAGHPPRLRSEGRAEYPVVVGPIAGEHQGD